MSSIKISVAEFDPTMYHLSLSNRSCTTCTQAFEFQGITRCEKKLKTYVANCKGYENKPLSGPSKETYEKWLKKE